MSETYQGRVGVGPAAVSIRIGYKFESYASDEFEVGQSLITWSGLKVKVLRKRPTGQFGNWKYRYGFEVEALMADGDATEALS